MAIGTLHGAAGESDRLRSGFAVRHARVERSRWRVSARMLAASLFVRSWSCDQFGVSCPAI